MSVGSNAPSAPRCSISVFFPCFNEEDNIASLVREALHVLPALADDFEIIVVDDGSSDATGRIADDLARTDPRVRVVHHEKNGGYGIALRSGFQAATKDLVFYTDGDGQFVLSEIARLLPHLDKADVVAGYRSRRRDPLRRRICGSLWNALVRRLLRFSSRDVDCAFKLCRRDLISRLSLKSTGALISAELLARSHRAGYRFFEVPVSHKPRIAGRQTGGNPKVILRAFRELWRLRKDILAAPRRDRGPDRKEFDGDTSWRQ
ncbi:MAG: glycosyltransferase family 2 protein [Planctomycetota bacterium]